MTFKIGMKVVLIDDSGWNSEDRKKWSYPVKGAVYTVREIIFDSIRLVEIRNGIGRSITEMVICEPYFRATRFRPAVSPKQQVSFTTGAPLDSEQWDNRKRVEVAS